MFVLGRKRVLVHVKSERTFVLRVALAQGFNI